MSEAKMYRKFTPAQKLELVLAPLRGDRSVAESVASTTSLRRCCGVGASSLLEAGAERFVAGQDRSAQAELRTKIGELERALGRKTYELEIAGTRQNANGAR